MKKLFKNLLTIAGISLTLATLVSCTRSANTQSQGWLPVPIQANKQTATTNAPATTQSQFGLYFPANNANAPIFTPTPDNPHPLPSIRDEDEQYTVMPGDTLGQIALRFSVPIEAIVQANQIPNPNLLEVGQVLTIPAPQPSQTGSGLKLIPDSELIASPASVIFDLDGFVKAQNGYLARYKEIVDEHTLYGTQIVRIVARDYSVNPRILLAMLEYRSEWVSNPNPKTKTLDYPLGWNDPWKEGLFKQLSWAANELNRGYYLWKANAVSSWILTDGTIVPVNPTINAGTAGVQLLLSHFFNRQQWDNAVSEDGFIKTYQTMFGNPFAYTYEPILPKGLEQPPLQLPFETGVTWFFTGGPHGGWGDGSAWAALDFAPPSDYLGCFESNAWVVAVCDGLIVRSRHGAVLQDIDGDGFEQTGWTVLYLHIATQDRIKDGSYVHAGDRIGHPSCEGGFSTGTHLHIARRYNGEWIPADGEIPFVMDDWVPSSAGNQYDGFLTKGTQTIEAWNGYSDINTIHR